MNIDDEVVKALNAAFLLVLLLLCVGLVIAMSSKTSAYARADRFSVRVRLPYGTTTTRESVVRRGRVSSLTTAVTMLVMTVALSPLLLAPVAVNPAFPIIVVIPVLVATGFASAVVSVRERLFRPAPDAPRVARARALGAVDYLDRFRLVLPWTLAVAAVLAFTMLALQWVRQPSRVDDAYAAAAVFALVLTAVVLVALPPVERLVLAQPQPATDTLELAWDDAFRTTTLSALRLSAALPAWLACALALAALWLGADGLFSTFASQVPTWGVIALTFLYPSTGRRLRAGLYPEWLRRPVAAEGTAA
ncbi:hypothetical protein ACI3KY_04815 [Microbacterium sp. ZW T2_14]|uniref:hypothetical protein n=1 Tax=Microbacterium sp. ZW T2_14 TaxID=3378079 RepID=UPI003855102B